MIGQIIKVISNDYTVKLDNNEKVICKARGVFRNKNITPLAGDFCTVDLDNKLITDIKTRKNCLTRPPVSNIDVAVVVMSGNFVQRGEPAIMPKPLKTAIRSF